jgi:hypothetical protein
MDNNQKSIGDQLLRCEKDLIKRMKVISHGVKPMLLASPSPNNKKRGLKNRASYHP